MLLKSYFGCVVDETLLKNMNMRAALEMINIIFAEITLPVPERFHLYSVNLCQKRDIFVRPWIRDLNSEC